MARRVKIIVVAALSFLVAICFAWLSHFRQSFDKEAWQQTPEHQRYVFAHDLLKRDLLIGQVEAHVVELLGQPSSVNREANAISYVVQNNVLGIYVLDIRFSGQKNQVASAQLRSL
jgi:hypothetical protein